MGFIIFHLEAADALLDVEACRVDDDVELLLCGVGRADAFLRDLGDGIRDEVTVAFEEDGEELVGEEESLAAQLVVGDDLLGEVGVVVDVVEEHVFRAELDQLGNGALAQPAHGEQFHGYRYRKTQSECSPSYMQLVDVIWRINKINCQNLRFNEFL